jgi:hypothetical protein
MEQDLDRKTRLLRMLVQMKARHNKKNDALAYDDIIQKDTLHLCVNKEYEMTFRAKDVIHSAYFPHFRAQMNCVPGQRTTLRVKPTISTQEMRDKLGNQNFNYVLLCNKICGVSHSKGHPRLTYPRLTHPRLTHPQSIGFFIADSIGFPFSLVFLGSDRFFRDSVSDGLYGGYSCIICS